MSSSEEPADKRAKIMEGLVVRCKYFVQRKKRFCKMTVGKGKQYCGEHEIHESANASVGGARSSDRIPCPLDPKHSISAAKLEKHLRICNAKPTERPIYIEPGINTLSDDEHYSDDTTSAQKLSDIPADELKLLIEKVIKLYDNSQVGVINELFLEHEAFKEELTNETYGPQTLKHLVQSASLLGILEQERFLQDDTSFVEFGAGKGQVAFWLATVLQKAQLTNVRVLLVDRESHRHKKDNKIEDREIIHRVRADIADLVLRKLDMLKGSNRVVGVGKHLCGGATDLALRCLVRVNRERQAEHFRSEGFVFALCCHHRCDWKTFSGKRFLRDNDISKKEFNLIVKMVSWAVCGTGTSRERRNSDVNDSNKYGLTRAQREDIGKKCKRVLDFARIKYLQSNGIEATLKFYVKSEITLENVCLIGHVK